jgi:tetratricopeptide (TPR) repeat protein
MRGTATPTEITLRNQIGPAVAEPPGQSVSNESKRHPLTVELPQVTTALMTQGERMAFHGRPGDGIGPLRTAVELCRAAEDQAGVHRATWLLGVCHASVGEYQFAMQELVPIGVLADHRQGASKYAVLASATMGSVYRQQASYQRAKQCDERALAGCNNETRFDALIGLAADSVGEGDADSANEHWEASHDVSEDEWRQVVRLAWVEAEISLMKKDPARAAAVSSAAAQVCSQAKAPRHRAKSLLFAGVAFAELGEVATADKFLSESIKLSKDVEAFPLLAPASEALARLGKVEQGAH